MLIVGRAVAADDQARGQIQDDLRWIVGGEGSTPRRERSPERGGEAGSFGGAGGQDGAAVGEDAAAVCGGLNVWVEHGTCSSPERCSLFCV